MSVETLHMIMEGRWFTETIQNLILEHNLKIANKLLDDLKPLPKYEQRRAIFNGDAQFLGHTLCDDKKCTQCKPLRSKGEFRYVTKPDKLYKEKLKEHQTFLKKYYFEIDGTVNIQKAVVSNLMVKKYTLEKIKEVRY